MTYLTTRAIGCDGRDYAADEVFPAPDHDVEITLVYELEDLGAIVKDRMMRPPKAGDALDKPLAKMKKPELLAIAVEKSITAVTGPDRAMIEVENATVAQLVAAIEATGAQDRCVR